MTQTLIIKEFSYSGNSVCAAVCVFPPDLHVDDTLAATMLALRPTLKEHACKHRGFGRFGDKLPGTTLPHLLEHLAIDLLVEHRQRYARDTGYGSDGFAAGGGTAGGGAAVGGAAGTAGGGAAGRLTAGKPPHPGNRESGNANAPAPYRPIAGATRWLDRERGIMQVRVSCTAQSAEDTCTAISFAAAMVNRYVQR